MMKNISTYCKSIAFGARTVVRSTSAGVNGSALHGAILFAVLAASLITGCQSSSNSPSRYVAPRVEGRVLDAQTRQPIGGVAVQRVDPDAGAGEIPRGALALEQPLDIRTRKDGSFVVASQRDLELFNRSSWYSVTFRFKHHGYTSFTTNYTPANATPTARGEPLVKAGDILLLPLSR